MPAKKDRRSERNANLFFGVVAVVGTALLVAIVFQSGAPVRTSVVGEAVSLDAATLLPAGARTSDASMAAVPADPQPTWFVGYELDGRGHLALIEWDRGRHRYAVTASASLAAGDAAINGLPTVTIEPLGTGAPAIIVVSGPHGGAYTDGVMLLLREGRSLRVAAMVEQPGTERPAFFLRGASVMNEAEFELRDLDPDGVKEAVATTTERDQNGNPRHAVSAYRWTDGRFVHDEQLSWAYTTSRNLFPEPPTP